MIPYKNFRKVDKIGNDEGKNNLHNFGRYLFRFCAFMPSHPKMILTLANSKFEAYLKKITYCKI